jgi:hypothetical protein
MLQLRDELWRLERRLSGQHLVEPTLAALQDPNASVEGTALSTELTLASMRPRRWPLIAAIVAPVAIVSGVLAFELGGVGARAALKSARSSEPAPAVAPPAPVPAAPAAPPTADSLAVAEAAQPAPVAPAHVLLGVTPATAHVFVNNQDLGASPVSLDVPPGSVLTVQLRHPNYATKSLELDGSQSKVVVELDGKGKHAKARGKAKRGASSSTPARATSRAPAQKGRGTDDRGRDESIGGQLFVQPWQTP